MLGRSDGDEFEGSKKGVDAMAEDGDVEMENEERMQTKIMTKERLLGDHGSLIIYLSKEEELRIQMPWKTVLLLSY